MRVSAKRVVSLTCLNAATLVITLLVVSVLPANAQYHFEVQPFVGYKWGGSSGVGANALGIDSISLNSSVAYGVTATFNPTEHMGLEFLWNRQPTNAVGHYFGGATYPTKVGVTLDQFHGDFLYSFAGHGSKLEPFVLFGIGATDMHGAGSSTTKFSWSVGGGVKYFVSRHIGLRAQARYAPTYLYSTNGGVWCNWWGYCWVASNDHFLNQGDVTGGIIFRF